jgi:hypothetical protein
MDEFCKLEAEGFKACSIIEVDAVDCSEHDEIGRHVALVESFSQPYPTRAREKPFTDGEMDSYG